MFDPISVVNHTRGFTSIVETFFANSYTQYCIIASSLIPMMHLSGVVLDSTLLDILLIIFRFLLALSSRLVSNVALFCKNSFIQILKVYHYFPVGHIYQWIHLWQKPGFLDKAVRHYCCILLYPCNFHNSRI